MEEPLTPPAGKPLTLASPQPVPPAQVEGALGALWRQAASRTKDGREEVTRACLWNLVVYNPKPKADFQDPAGHGYGLRALLDQVVPALPARIIRLEREPKAKPAGKCEAVAHVAAKCIPNASGTPQIYGEEVDLTAFGKGGESHFPSLVRALLQPNLPIGLLWLDDLPHRGWLLEQLAAICNRLLIDTQSAGQEADLGVVAGLAADLPHALVDIGWMRLGPLRHLAAGFFDGNKGEKTLRRLERVRAVSTPRGHNGALLLGAWLLCRCGFSGFRKVTPQPKGARVWRAARGKNTVTLEIATREGEGGADGLLELELWADGRRFALERVDGETVALEAPGRAERRLPLHGYSDAELVVAGLGAHGLDPMFARVLETAAALVGPAKRKTAARKGGRK